MLNTRLPYRSSIGITLCLFLASACTVGEPEYLEVIGERGDIAPITRHGTDANLDIATWNIEWFGSTFKGPSDEGLQLDRVRDVILGSDLDIWGLQEVTSEVAFQELLANLPGYAGVLASDPAVERGSDYYHRSEQKVALIYKESVAQVTRARIVLTDSDYEFAGRPPLEVTFDVTLGGETDQLVMLVLHAKAMTDATSYDRRQRGSEALHAYLDLDHASDQVILIGDLNDDVDTSIRRGMDSPYQNFVLDSEAYTFPTKALSDAGITSTVRYSDMIDHHLVTNELMARYVPDSVDALDGLLTEIDDYDDTTSDHYPVMTSFTWGDGGGVEPGGEALVLINEILANEPGSATENEFVEIVNVGDASADLSGWTLSDNTGERHLFAQDTVLEPGAAIVVFGGEAGIPAGLSSAVAASRGSLGLNNSGDTVYLDDAAAASVDQVSYTSELAVDGVSMNRSTDGDINATFALHDSLAATTSSPGTRMDGGAW